MRPQVTADDGALAERATVVAFAGAEVLVTMLDISTVEPATVFTACLAVLVIVLVLRCCRPSELPAQPRLDAEWSHGHRVAELATHGGGGATDEEIEKAASSAMRYFDDPSGGHDPKAVWHKVSSASSYPLECFYYTDGEKHAVKVCAPFDVGVEFLIATAREIDLLPAWNKYVVWAAVLKDFALTRVRVAARLWTPPPFSNVRAVVDASLDDLLDTHGCMLISSATTDPTPSDLPPELHGLYEVPMHGLMAYTPRKGGGSLMTAVNHLPFNLVPRWVLNLMLYVAMPWVYSAARAMLADAVKEGEPLADRVLKGPKKPLYDMIRARCTAHANGTQGPPPLSSSAAAAVLMTPPSATTIERQ